MVLFFFPQLFVSQPDLCRISWNKEVGAPGAPLGTTALIVLFGFLLFFF